MKRQYEAGTIEGVSSFVGIEVENTTCKGMKTYFIADEEYFVELLITEAKALGCGHIYLGANKLYSKQVMDWAWINEVVKAAALSGIEVTLDFPVHVWDYVLEYINVGASNLHLNVSVEMPNISRCSNVNVKVDDIDFECTNPGVWVYPVRQDSAEFNDWTVYGKDEIVS